MKYFTPKLRLGSNGPHSKAALGTWDKPVAPYPDAGPLHSRGVLVRPPRCFWFARSGTLVSVQRNAERICDAFQFPVRIVFIPNPACFVAG